MKFLFVLLFLTGCCSETDIPAVQHMWDKCEAACDKEGIEMFQASFTTYECRCKVHY